MAEILNSEIDIDTYNDLINEPDNPNPNNYEVRTTQFTNCYKIIDKKNGLSYTSGINKIKQRIIIPQNIVDKKYYEKEVLVNYNEAIDKNDLLYISKRNDCIYQMFDLIELFYPNLLSEGL